MSFFIYMTPFYNKIFIIPGKLDCMDQLHIKVNN